MATPPWNLPWLAATGESGSSVRTELHIGTSDILTSDNGGC